MKMSMEMTVEEHFTPVLIFSITAMNELSFICVPKKVNCIMYIQFFLVPRRLDFAKDCEVGVAIIKEKKALKKVE